MSEPIHDPELRALQTVLAGLTPAPDGINLGQLLFRAGQVSVPRRSAAWPWATAASALLAASLGAVLLLRPAPQPIEHIVVVREEPQTPARSASEGNTPPVPVAQGDADRRPEDADALRLRRQVLAHGVDALPESAPWPAVDRPRDADTLLDRFPGDGREPLLRRLQNSLRSGDAS
jgi:hypothetical protein